MSATTVNKRSLKDANIEASNPAKKRKLNEKNEKSESPATSTTVPLSTDSPSTSESTNVVITDYMDDTDMVPPTMNPAINNVNVEVNDNDNDSNKNKKNDNTANKSENDDDPNSSVTNFEFKASDFTFGDNSWVRQTSNTSNSNDGEGIESIANDNTIDSFSEFAGLGFKKVLDDENSKSKQEATSDDDKDDKNDNNDKNDGDDKNDKNDKKDTVDAWGGAWSNSNPDGTFKLNFDWGSWDSSNAKIDLNPSSKVGWESQAPKFDPNSFEEDDKTKQVLKQMTGEQDTGDTTDDIKCSIHCKVYNLEKHKYVERGKGTVNINTYKLNDKLRARILCRRDQILTTIINAPILKEMKFEKVGGFIRFGVVEQIKNENENENENKKEEKDKDKNTNSKQEEEENDDDDDDDEDDDDEDNDINTEIKTYLVKPIGDKSQIDTLLNKIKEIQKEISQ